MPGGTCWGQEWERENDVPGCGNSDSRVTTVCIATPRIDVCNELYGRMKEDFSCSHHGGIGPYFRTPLQSPTHQLLKFIRLFDLHHMRLHAFPFVDNPIQSSSECDKKRREHPLFNSKLYR